MLEEEFRVILELIFQEKPRLLQIVVEKAQVAIL